MDKRQIIILPTSVLKSNQTYAKLLTEKQMLPIGKTSGFLQERANITVRLKDGSNIFVDDNCQIATKGEYFCLRMSPPALAQITKILKMSHRVFLVFEGSNERARVIFLGEKISDDILSEIESQDATIRLAAYGLPPTDVTLVDTASIVSELYLRFAKRDEELFSLRTNRFIRTPHILTYLFAHVMSLKSKDHINYISTLRVISDHLRELLKPRIRKIERNHHAAWAAYYGQRIAFVDGGMSRIVSLPGTEPMGIRVGVYAVKPGETSVEEREKWNLYPYVIGDVLSESPYRAESINETDSKRLQEAARYILEPLTAYNHVQQVSDKPAVVFLHGPLQNKFEIYDGEAPHFVPGVSPEFLGNQGITVEDVKSLIQYIPKSSKRSDLWNDCIPIYLYIMKKIFSQPIPYVGVVERARSSSFLNRILARLVADSVITEAAKVAIQKDRDKYDIHDEFLFGCILDEGEYIEPIPLQKNFSKDAHDVWQPVVAQFPIPSATLLKVSANNFPFRVEFNGSPENQTLEKIMSLLYHTSLLLPNYAFPVGIDIVDKYAKIPDWLSKGISSHLTANILYKVLQKGDDRLLRQVRQLLAKSPRDFFFRPKA
jgi:hypothetical protein